MADRPGTVKEIHEDEWVVTCDLCGHALRRPTYQEASIALTEHLDDVHTEAEPTCFHCLDRRSDRASHRCRGCGKAPEDKD